MTLIVSLMGVMEPGLWVIISMVIIWRASEGFETASEYIGRNLTDGVRGASINAIASSIPELLTTLFFLVLLRDAEGFAGGIGTTAGSAIFNGMVIPSLVIFAVLGIWVVKKGAASKGPKLQISRVVILRDGLALIACELLLIFVVSGESLDWYHGLILMGAYMAYLVVMFKIMNVNREGAHETEDEQNQEAAGLEESSRPLIQALFRLDLGAIVLGKRKITTNLAWFLLLLSVSIIAAACFLLVYACNKMGNNLGISTYIIAVLIASAATSVPDTLISIRDARDGNYDDALSNALGSNIFDICFALGFPLFLYTLLYQPIPLGAQSGVGESISELRIILLCLTIVAFFTYLIGKYMTRLKALTLLGMYLLFTMFIVGKARNHPTALEISDFIQQVMG